MKRNYFTKTAIFCLCFVMLFISIVVPDFTKKAYADDTDEEIEYDTLLTGYDISDEYIEQVDEQVNEQYLEYVYFDGNHIWLQTTPIEEKYGSIILREDFTTDMIHIDDEDDYFHIATVRMIHRNMDIMNDLVDDEEGYIDENYEFFFWDTDLLARFRGWNFQLKWNKLSADFDKDYAVIIAIACIVFDVFWNIRDAQSLVDTYERDGDQFIIDCVLTAFIRIPSEVASYFVSKEDAILSHVCNVADWMIEILRASRPLRTCITKLVNVFMPSITDCMSVCVNSIFKCNGLSVKICWIPTKQDRWGVSLKSI